jgi:hypothetical protein
MQAAVSWQQQHKQQQTTLGGARGGNVLGSSWDALWALVVVHLACNMHWICIRATKDATKTE